MRDAARMTTIYSAVSAPDNDIGSCDVLVIPLQDASNTSDSTYGYLNLEITQGAFSKTDLREIDPLDLPTLLGNIGGA